MADDLPEEWDVAIVHVAVRPVGKAADVARVDVFPCAVARDVGRVRLDDFIVLIAGGNFPQQEVRRFAHVSPLLIRSSPCHKVPKGRSPVLDNLHLRRHHNNR